MEKLFISLVAIHLGMVSCKPSSDDKSLATVYFGGEMLTMERDNPEYVEAVVVRDGMIAFAGDLSEAKEIAGKTPG